MGHSARADPVTASSSRAARYDLKLWTAALHESATYPP
jgi:hypothetical protein